MLSTQTIIIIVISLFIIFLIYHYFDNRTENFSNKNPDKYIVSFSKKDGNRTYDITKIVNDIKTAIMADASNNFMVDIIFTNEKKRGKEDDMEQRIVFNIKNKINNKDKIMNLKIRQDGTLIIFDNTQKTTLIDIKIYLQRLMNAVNPEVSAEEMNPLYKIDVRYANNALILKLKSIQKVMFGLDANAESEENRN
jgi:hypothetical protein